MTVAATIAGRRVDLLDAFTERAHARAYLWHVGDIGLHEAVDELQRQAERAGLVSRVLPAADLLPEAIKTAQTIASMSRPAVLTAKDAINRAFETTLAEGVRFERRAFYALFATKDQKEGMSAFIEKRRPKFQNR